jgi:hypothetical protein
VEGMFAFYVLAMRLAASTRHVAWQSEASNCER